MNGERKLALFIDFENIARGVKEAQYKAFEIKLVLERLLGFAAYAVAFLLAFAAGVHGLANEIMSGVAIFFVGILAALAVLFIATRYPAWHGIRVPEAHLRPMRRAPRQRARSS